MEVIYENTDDLREFLKEYELYISKNGHLPVYLNRLSKEYIALKKAFPDVDFSTTARIKSPHSACDKRSKGKINICDIYANKYIIHNVNGITEESILESVCYKFFNFIEEFNFKNNAKLIGSKDYIKNPKPTSYKSLHATYEYNLENIEDDNNEERKKFKYETQIKTYKMRWNEKFGPASHRTTYKDRSEVFLDTVPIYIGLIPDTDYFETKSKEYSFKEYYGFAFKDFFGISYDDFLKNKKATRPYAVTPVGVSEEIEIK